jgi:hypothetical protein
MERKQQVSRWQQQPKQVNANTTNGSHPMQTEQHSGFYKRRVLLTGKSNTVAEYHTGLVW